MPFSSVLILTFVWIVSSFVFLALVPRRSRLLTALLYGLAVAIPFITALVLLPLHPPFGEELAILSFATGLATLAGWFSVHPSSATL